MRQPTIVFIGSTVVDILLRVPHLPKQQEDINIQSQSYSLGGCAFNASWMCHLLGVKHILFSPVGTGIYGDFVQAQMQQYHLTPPILQSTSENGCCYCLIDDCGERSFISYHGAEYIFQKEWFSILDEQPVDVVYICGLEIEEESGIHIISYLEQHPEQTIYFATGPRIQYIQEERMKRIFACSPILHLNEEEAKQYTGCDDVEQASKELYNKTHNTIIITLGAQGCSFYDGIFHIIKSVAVNQVDTTGAGDCHIGSLIAYQTLGYTIEEAIQKANNLAGSIVAKQGAFLTEEEFNNLI